jgi:hypothetical protein
MTPPTNSPADAHRKKLALRTRITLIKSGNPVGKLTPAQKKTPSQRKSEAAKKKDLARANVTVSPTVRFDCHTCPKQPCGKTTSICEQQSIVHRCKKCGGGVRHYVDPNVAWTHCPPCKAELERRT